MSTTGNGSPDTTSHERRLELAALSRQLREEHLQLRETYILLRGESKELSEESKLLRTYGHSLREVLDEFAGLLSVPPSL
jgi:hypothetical protein